MHVSFEHQWNIPQKRFGSQGIILNGFEQEKIETILMALETPLLIVNVIFSVSYIYLSDKRKKGSITAFDHHKQKCVFLKEAKKACKLIKDRFGVDEVI